MRWLYRETSQQSTFILIKKKTNINKSALLIKITTIYSYESYLNKLVGHSYLMEVNI